MAYLSTQIDTHRSLFPLRLPPVSTFLVAINKANNYYYSISIPLVKTCLAVTSIDQGYPMDTICIFTVEYREFHPRNIASNNIVYCSILIWRKVRVKQIGRFKEWVNPTTAGQMSTSCLAVDKKGVLRRAWIQLAVLL